MNPSHVGIGVTVARAATGILDRSWPTPPVPAPRSTSPRSRRSSGRASPTPGTSSTWSGGPCATSSSGRHARDWTSARARTPRETTRDPARVGRPPVPRRRAVRHGRRAEGRPPARDHDLPRGGLRRGAPQAGGDLRRRRRDRPGAARLHDQRDGGPAARRRLRRPVRRGEGARGALARHAARPRGLVRRRPPADGPRRAVRGAARGRPRRRASSRRWRAMAERLDDRLGRADPRRARPAARRRRAPPTGSRCSSRPGSPSGSCPRCRRSGWSRTRSTTTRTCSGTRTPWSPATEPRLRLRLAALLHDIGKPATRQVLGRRRVVPPPRGGRCADGARAADGAALPDARRSTTSCTLIELHLRFHGYGEGWTDAAVRRYVRDAGPLLDDLNQLTRADVTTRNPKRAEAFRRAAGRARGADRGARRAGEPGGDAPAARRAGGDGAPGRRRPGRSSGEALAMLMERAAGTRPDRPRTRRSPRSTRGPRRAGAGEA